VNRNLFGNNGLDYELVAGIRTAKLNTAINVMENWWGSGNVSDIKKRIFDFDDWNNHAIARFRYVKINSGFWTNCKLALGFH